MKKYIIASVALVASCSILKPITRTANEIARELCVLSAAQQPEEALDGMAVDAYCNKHLQSWLDEVLAAQRAQESLAGFSREVADAGAD